MKVPTGKSVYTCQKKEDISARETTDSFTYSKVFALREAAAIANS